MTTKGSKKVSKSKKKQSSKKKVSTKKIVSKKTSASPRSRRTQSFPAFSFEEALTLASAVQKHAAGEKVRRLTLFDQMQKSPDSGSSRQLISNSNKYGLTKGGYQGEYIELTAEGQLATAPDSRPIERLRARFASAIELIEPFNSLYEHLKGNRIAATSVLEDFIVENGVPEKEAKECIELFLVNCKFVGILKPIAGAERIISIEQALEEHGSASADSEADATQNDISENAGFTETASTNSRPSQSATEDWDKICFYIAPIGADDSEHRKHSDLFLGAIVEPAVEEFGLEVVRADQIGKPGMITAQIIEYILKSKLVVADLSFHNPNVFYELCLRHVCKLPTVQIIRKSDKIPFDIDQFRTVQIDMESVYTLVPNLQLYKAEISTQVRNALRDPDNADNPLSVYYPSLKATF